MSREMPGSVVNSLRVLALLVATSGVITLLTWLMSDDILMTWAEGNPTAQEILAQGGIEALRADQISPGFVALAVVAFVGFALLSLVLGAFLAGGFPWARWVLTATAFMGALVVTVCLQNQMPTIFVVLSVLLILLGALLVVLLWRKDTTAYLRDDV
ncbi:hypothetical protein [Nocardioides seonyuensis]|uniref:hypothetical protein n=1 Tax=Nocardioides seonyuensis TaxID=2518371 RepID=UPI0014244EC5|nr:hypothetical protein [Nocardioides seonyuensis]